MRAREPRHARAAHRLQELMQAPTSALAEQLRDLCAAIAQPVGTIDPVADSHLAEIAPVIDCRGLAAAM